MQKLLNKQKRHIYRHVITYCKIHSFEIWTALWFGGWALVLRKLVGIISWFIEDNESLKVKMLQSRKGKIKLPLALPLLQQKAQISQSIKNATFSLDCNHWNIVV